MGKRKCEDELLRFVWKRNIVYDVMLLSEVQSKNPYAFNNQKPVWIEIAKVLQNGELKMRVTDRSCRERVVDLLKTHRENERQSSRASGIAEAEMTELQDLLTSVAKLQEMKPDKQLKALYSRKDRSEADTIRAGAVVAIQDSDISEDDNSNADTSDINADNLNVNAGNSNLSAGNSNFNASNSNAIRNVVDSNLPPASLNIFFSNQEEDEDLNNKGPSSSSSRPNPKRELVQYLEKKAMKEIEVRKEELKIREKEVEIKAKETENKTKELELLLAKTQAEADDRKRMNDLLLALMNRK